MEKSEIELIKSLQNGIKLERRPFLRIAKELGISEEEVLTRIKKLQDQGIIRRLGVAVRPEKAGFSCNALVAWKIPEDRVEEVGKTLAEVSEISHCYERACPPGWPWNFYTMIHCTSAEHLDDLLSNLRNRLRLNEYRVFKTVRELKKTSMQYFTEERSK